MRLSPLLAAAVSTSNPRSPSSPGESPGSSRLCLSIPEILVSHKFHGAQTVPLPAGSSDTCSQSTYYLLVVWPHFRKDAGLPCCFSPSLVVLNMWVGTPLRSRIRCLMYQVFTL